MKYGSLTLVIFLHYLNFLFPLQDRFISWFYSVSYYLQIHTSCTMMSWCDTPSRYDRLPCHRSRIAKVSFHNGCMFCAPFRPLSPGFSVSVSQFHMDHIRMHRTSGNRQGNACRIWQKRYNPNGELFDGYSYQVSLSSSIILKISYTNAGTTAFP